MARHHTEQAARAYLMYHLAMRGYTIQMTDSRFPCEDMLVVSPNGKHFGIEVKGQSTRNFWRYTCPDNNLERFYVFVYVNLKGSRVFVMTCEEAQKRWHEYRDKCIAQGRDYQGQWGIAWKTPFDCEDKWALLPK